MSFETDPFQEETDLQAWSDELGAEYTIGQQGSFGQPMRDMSDSRLDATIDSVTQELRENAGLPVIPNEDELALHRTKEELDTMDESERLKWQLDTLDWLIENPNATINHLID